MPTGMRCSTSTSCCNVRVSTVHIHLAMQCAFTGINCVNHLCKHYQHMLCISQHAAICSSCCDDLIVAPLNWICPYLADLNTADKMQIHTLPLRLSHKLTALSSSSGQEKRFDFLFKLATAWCWDGFQNSLSLSLCRSYHLSSCLSHTCWRPADVSVLRPRLVRTTAPSPSSNPGWAKTIRQHLSWAQASCTAHYLHSHSNALTHTQALFCSSQTHNGSKYEYTEYIHKRVVILHFPSLIKVWAVPHLSSSAHH